jgi:hypothetical protein
MRTAALIFFVGAASLSVASCTRDGEGEGELQEPDSPDSSGADRDRPEARAEPDPVEPLADGSHSVFGLRIPRGMKPTTGPNRVYRFESTFDLAQVKRRVMRQVETGHLLEEPTGYLIRKARVVDPVGTNTPNVLLAVRIFRGRLGGATMDVWIEIESLSALRAGKDGLGNVVAEDDAEKPRPKLTPSQTAARQQDRKQVFDALEAAAQGKPLPSDPESSLNY